MIIKGKNYDVSDRMRQYTEEKIGKMTRFFSNFIEAEVELSEMRNPRIDNRSHVEVTIHTKGSVIRAKADSSDMHSAIDIVAEKIEKQVKRFKDRLKNHNGDTSIKLLPIADDLLPEAGPMIVKTKSIPFKPMSASEAQLQMELLGHDFFIFTNSEGEQLNVLYRRRDGNYGLIEPVLS